MGGQHAREEREEEKGGESRRRLGVGGMAGADAVLRALGSSLPEVRARAISSLHFKCKAQTLWEEVCGVSVGACVSGGALAERKYFLSGCCCFFRVLVLCEVSA